MKWYKIQNTQRFSFRLSCENFGCPTYWRHKIKNLVKNRCCPKKGNVQNHRVITVPNVRNLQAISYYKIMLEFFLVCTTEKAFIIEYREHYLEQRGSMQERAVPTQTDYEVDLVCQIILAWRQRKALMSIQGCRTSRCQLEIMNPLILQIS